MSTRGLIGFIVDGQEKFTYNHSDSYPSWLGREVLEFLASGFTLEQIREGARHIRLVDSEKNPTAEDIAHCKKYTNLGVSRESDQDWYCLLRNAQGDFKAYLDVGLMIDGRAFVKDSLFCEWAYIINLDTGKLEVYRGFNKNPKAGGRYAKLRDKPYKGRDGKMHRPEYCGIVLVDEFDIAQYQATTSNKFTKDKLEKMIKRIYTGWEKIAADQREAEERTKKAKEEFERKGLRETT